MNAKKIAGFLLMRPAFTQRNLTSIVLVGVFIGSYFLMGGKITTSIPAPDKRNPFGSVKSSGVKSPGTKQTTSQKSVVPSETNDIAANGSESPDSLQAAKEVLGELPNTERSARQRAIMGRTEFSEEERQEDGAEPLDKEGLIEGADFSKKRKEWSLQRQEKKTSDALSGVEERLKITRSGKK